MKTPTWHTTDTSGSVRAKEVARLSLGNARGIKYSSDTDPESAADSNNITDTVI